MGTSHEILGPLAQVVEHLSFDNKTHNQARSAKPHSTNEMQGAPARAQPFGAPCGPLEPRKPFQTGNTGNGGGATFTVDTRPQ